MKGKKIVSVGLVTAMTLALAAAPAFADSTTESAEAAAIDYSKIKVGVLLKPESNTYWSGMGAAIEKWAKEKGCTVDLYYAESESNISGQLDQMENMIGKDYDAICAAPLSASNLVQGVVDATKKNIVVVNVDEQIDPSAVKDGGGVMYAQYTTDNELVGKKAADYIIEQIGSGQGGIVEGTAGNATSQARTDGATKEFEATDGFEIVASTSGEWDQLKAQDAAAAMITANPDLKAIYCCNDVMALGAVSAVQNANKQDSIIVVGTDATEDGKNSIAKGEETATIGQDNTGIGIQCVEAACRAVSEGWKPADHVGEDVDVEYVDSFLVTKDNVADYQ